MTAMPRAMGDLRRSESSSSIICLPRDQIDIKHDPTSESNIRPYSVFARINLAHLLRSCNDLKNVFEPQRRVDHQESEAFIRRINRIRSNESHPEHGVLLGSDKSARAEVRNTQESVVWGGFPSRRRRNF